MIYQTLPLYKTTKECYFDVTLLYIYIFMCVCACVHACVYELQQTRQTNICNTMYYGLHDCVGCILGVSYTSRIFPMDSIQRKEHIGYRQRCAWWLTARKQDWNLAILYHLHSSLMLVAGGLCHTTSEQFGHDASVFFQWFGQIRNNCPPHYMVSHHVLRTQFTSGWVWAITAK